MNEKAKYLQAANIEDYLTVDEASQVMGVKDNAIRNYLYAGKLTTYKFKSLTLLSKNEVEGWKSRRG